MEASDARVVDERDHPQADRGGDRRLRRRGGGGAGAAAVAPIPVRTASATAARDRTRNTRPSLAVPGTEAARYLARCTRSRRTRRCLQAA